MNILVVYYGIGRGGSLTHNSYNKNITIPLKRSGHKLTAIHILKKVDYLANKRSREFGVLSFSKEFSLGINKTIWYDENELLDLDLLEFSKKYRDMHLDDFASNSNLICQLEKINKSTQVVNYSDYDRVVLIRDDLVFHHSSLPWDDILYLSKFGPVVSKWSWHDGIADRFLVASPSVAIKIAKRISHARDSIINIGSLNGEMLKYYVFKIYKLTPIALNIKFSRVRLNNVILRERFILPVWRPRELIRVLIAQINTFILIIKWKISKIRGIVE